MYLCKDGEIIVGPKRLDYSNSTVASQQYYYPRQCQKTASSSADLWTTIHRHSDQEFKQPKSKWPMSDSRIQVYIYEIRDSECDSRDNGYLYVRLLMWVLFSTGLPERSRGNKGV
jgi:hypothetical protein